MERLKLVQKPESEPGASPYKEEKPQVLEDFRAVVKSLTENALKVMNRISAKEMSKLEPNAELVEDYSLLFHYLDYMKRFVSGKG